MPSTTAGREHGWQQRRRRGHLQRHRAHAPLRSGPATREAPLLGSQITIGIGVRDFGRHVGQNNEFVRTERPISISYQSPSRANANGDIELISKRVHHDATPIRDCHDVFKQLVVSAFCCNVNAKTEWDRDLDSPPRQELSRTWQPRHKEPGSTVLLVPDCSRSASSPIRGRVSGGRSHSVRLRHA
jgi:hypothetical protein